MSERHNFLFYRGIWIAAIPVIAILTYFIYTNGPGFDDVNLTGSGPSSAAQISGNISDQGPVRLGPSGLALPRFVSLKSDRVNIRVGPSQDHAIAWVFRRQGLPVEIIAEFENWRQIRDSDGAEGWVIQSLLSGRRTVLVAPWIDESSKTFPLSENADENAQLVARLEPNILASLLECENSWCRINVQDIDGWMPQNLLWGVGPKETL